MLAPKLRFGGVPHRLSGVIFKVCEVLGGLERSGRVLKSVLHGSWAVSQSSSGSWVASVGVLGGLGDVLGVMLAPKMAKESRKY